MTEEKRAGLETFIENAPNLESLELLNILNVEIFSCPFFKKLVLNELSPSRLRGIHVRQIHPIFCPDSRIHHPLPTRKLSELLWYGFDEYSFNISQFCGRIEILTLLNNEGDIIPYRNAINLPMGSSIFIDLQMLSNLCKLEQVT